MCNAELRKQETISHRPTQDIVLDIIPIFPFPFPIKVLGGILENEIILHTVSFMLKGT